MGNGLIAINSRTVGNPSTTRCWSIGEKSRFHSFTLEKANGRRTLVQSPVAVEKLDPGKLLRKTLR